jgi:hypothetical protein
MVNCECGEVHLRYYGYIEWKTDEQPIIRWRSVTCEACGKSSIFLSKDDGEDEINR